MVDLTPFTRRLILARYDKKKLGIGFVGGPALWFIKERDNGIIDDNDAVFLANIIAAYNEKVKHNDGTTMGN